MKDYILKDKFFIKKLIAYALPICFQTLMQASVAAADAFMLGGIDQNSMSAVSLATQVQFVQNLILSGIICAASILGAQYWGKKDLKTIDDIFALAIRLGMILSIIFFVGCYFFPELLMSFYTNEKVLIEIGADYLRIASFSYLLVGATQCYIVMTRVTDHIKTSVIVSSSAVILNIIFNYIYIYVFKMDATGAAIATDIARVIEFGSILFMSFRPGYVKLKIACLFKFNKMLTIDFVKCMLPLMAASMLWGIGFTSYSSFMGHLGTDAAAANSVTSVVRDLICSASDGIANGGGIMIGNELGAGNLDKGKLYGTRMAKISFVLGIGSGILMLLVTPLLLDAIKLTPEAREYLKQMMVVMAIYMLGRYVNTIVINGVFAAGGDTIFDVYSLFVTMWCIAIPLAFLGTYILHWPVIVIYACTCLDEVGKIPWVMYHFKKYKWVKDLTR